MISFVVLSICLFSGSITMLNDCRNSTADLNYSGTIHTTRNGKTCRSWKTTPHYQNEKANYCRTPPGDGDNIGGPWCYIDEHRSWERCNIPVCGGSFCPDLSTYHLLTSDKKSRYQYGEIAIVDSCQKGYSHIQKTYLECTSTGTWNDAIPTCEKITCQPFTLDNNVHASIQPDLNKYDVNTRVRFACISGFTGLDIEAVCLDNGQWSSQQIPRCSPVPCPVLSNTKHMNQLINHSGYHYGDTITFQCLNGFILSGPLFITCRCSRNNSIGYWSAQQPLCLAVACHALRQVPHQMLEPVLIKYSYRDNVTFKCNDGYELSSADTITCQSDGTWSNRQPTCTGVPCPNLPHIYKALLPNQTKEYRYPEALNITCETGYVVESSDLLQCNSSGLWNSIPQCIEKSQAYKDSMENRGKCISLGFFGGILAAIVLISAGLQIATCFYYRKLMGKSAAVYEDMQFKTVERHRSSKEETYSELT